MRVAARLPKKSPAVICPNPKCGKEIEESIILNVLSVNPPKQYEACPYCFSELEKEKVSLEWTNNQTSNGRNQDESGDEGAVGIVEV
ncbi:MAG: hypothetical protein P8X84_06800, partial [Candidatus Bathyarchaeota archaeon]